MKDFDFDRFKTKFNIAEAAVELYQEHGDTFTIKQVAENTDLDVAEVFDYFPNKPAILEFYYESLVIRYRLMLEEIDDFDNYLLAEKLSNFVYSSFDLIHEQKDFVQKTFNQIILRSYSRTGYEKEVDSLFREFFEEDGRISSSSSLLMSGSFFNLLRKKYLYLVRFWLNDESEDKELSMELTDKYTAFLQEIMYSATIDKSVDLARFMFSNSIFSRGCKSIRNLFPEIEIRD